MQLANALLGWTQQQSVKHQLLFCKDSLILVHLFKHTQNFTVKDLNRSHLIGHLIFLKILSTPPKVLT